MKHLSCEYLDVELAMVNHQGTIKWRAEAHGLDDEGMPVSFGAQDQRLEDVMHSIQKRAQAFVEQEG